MSTLDEIFRTTSDSYTLTEQDARLIARPSPRVPLMVDQGRGALLKDVDGREVIDLTSGWNVVNVGWNHPRVVEATLQATLRSTYAPPWCSHPGRIEYARRLTNWVGDEWVVWCGVGGSEAIEAAIKIARRATGRQAIVGFEHAYHGATLTSMLAGGRKGDDLVGITADEKHRLCPLPDSVRGDPTSYPGLLRKAVLAGEPPAAVMLEPVFTNPGVIYGIDDFYLTLQDAGRISAALIIVDEIGTGFGRTGKHFAFQHWDLQPDMVVIGKAITSGAVPMSAVLLRPELAEAVAGPAFSSTYGWTPPACAAAAMTLTVIDDEDLVAGAASLGQQALEILRPLVNQHDHVAAVRGKGLEIGVELVTADGTPDWEQMRRLTRRLLARGVFAESSSYTSTLLLMPPLVISEDQLIQALSIVGEEVAAAGDVRSGS